MNSEPVTSLYLSFNQIKYILDVMWGTDPVTAKLFANSHGVDDTELERYLSSRLTDGDITKVDYTILGEK
ncbi:hypothetical protein S-PM2d003 [Synechococcus phage S-PM2]|uniref:Hypothetical-Protein / belonging to T4-LIKE GC: 750 n=1 Tax=Synechococcus phage S-PM2 TaxID=238854 RepID=Q5GQR7_BPSYP|nr:Hypothetical-Protein / belonging to T4-LIKE GC: 750 [Synechococcus phage S-PM2]CAF34067.1 Hypothetical-Protein / belonging to T4-LIKE GC: 750 [Synechococcus phage S-PM2]CFW42136.1 hypothetical protein S-PM2d003 [Synechococcus phage S-PM2]